MFDYFKASKFFTYAALFAVVIVTSSTLFPFITGKYVWFRSAALLGTALFALGLIFSPRAEHFLARLKKLFSSKIVIAVSVFVAMFLIACIFAYDPHAAFWSNFERGEGGFQILCFYLWFLLLGTLFEGEKDWRRAFGYSAGAGALVLLYGVVASFGASGFIAAGGGRFAGSLGNPAYIGTYTLFLMIFSAWMLFTSPSRGAKISWGALIAIFMAGFIGSETRGAGIGLALGLFAYLVYLIWRSSGKVRQWGIGALTALLLIGGSLVYFSDTNFVKSLPGGRLFELSLSESTAQTRLWTWGSALKGFEERPITGWGPENFAVVFDKHFDTRHYLPNLVSETWFDRAHSVFFDYLAEIGILGLVSYLAIFVAYFWEAFKSGALKRNHAVSAGVLVAIPFAYLGQGIVLFDVLPTYLNLFLALAFAAWYFETYKSKHQSAD